VGSGIEFTGQSRTNQSGERTTRMKIWFLKMDIVANQSFDSSICDNSDKIDSNSKSFPRAKAAPKVEVFYA
jgi:hypothetical protein